ncbi:putative oxidoreductase,short chain dehydrogenase [Eremomyces bilateralis CBS 781.70]|uniref:3-dehydrosphinganine reductase n=1 Tax=Eremomyces bilateralis CBS 781.70 TaxID=1392243 RepID=A0A6G1GHR3_9PEZI|nr:putative oxidoreductase,short chain dehydrogenase [Eremomyces bilateralis CBS 781.70]KAF1817522.1 putative oxidoreductase,short chain dehydrogenase [Eremomyces bilateralis CBS 781.70]
MAFEVSIQVLVFVTLLTIAAYIGMGWFSRKSHFQVNGQTVLITGASQGLGEAIGYLLASKGANVIIVARDVSKLQKALEFIRSGAKSPSQRFEYLSADVTSEDENNKLLAKATEWNNGNPPDIIWACAGVSHPGLFMDISTKTLRDQMDINYWAATYLLHGALKIWLGPLLDGSSSATTTSRSPSSPAGKKKPRHFILTSSVLAYCGIAGYSPYSPAKAALRSLCDTLRQELQLYTGAYSSHPDFRPVDIRMTTPANILSPGFENENKVKHPVTKMLEEGDPAQTPKVVAQALVEGLENGEYMPTTTLLSWAMKAGSLNGSPRMLGDVLLSGLAGWIYYFVGPDMEDKVRKFGQQRGVRVS